jgi:hypothetical protein
MTWPAVSETMALVDSTGMWQSMQFSAILFPIVLNLPQLSNRWQVRQRSEYAAAGRSAWWTSWQVEQVIFGEDK